MKAKKVISFLLAVLMALALMPAVSLAEEFGAFAQERIRLNMLNRVWAELEKVDTEAFGSGIDRAEVIDAVYKAALNIEDTDKDSFSDINKDGFFFTVDGMHCVYNYRLRHEINSTGKKTGGQTIFTKGTGSQIYAAEGENLPSSPDIFLVEPYWGFDQNFTDQYVKEADSIAQATGGSVTKLQGTDATGPAIAQNYTDKGVVIYDSHGGYSGDSSYLCLHTDAGITSADYDNGWAVKDSDGWAWIDGRYIENHASGKLSNCFVWMAICEGMKKEGKGTTGAALIRKGAAGVYGYSQPVSFTGDYHYEAKFWSEMKNGKTVAQAYKSMVDLYTVPDPSGNNPQAYPIVMSPLDPFPKNPDAPQTVQCDWKLLGGGSTPPVNPSEPPASDPPVIGGDPVTPIGKTTGFYFETDPFNEGWTVFEDFADNKNWEWKYNDSEVNALEGSGCMASYSLVNGSSVLPRNWLVSPLIWGGGSVSFKMKALNYTGDKVGVCVSTDNGNIWSELDAFTTTSSAETHTVSLGNYNAQKLKIAFHHYDYAGNSAAIIDAVEVTVPNFTPPTPKPTPGPTPKPTPVPTSNPTSNPTTPPTSEDIWKLTDTLEAGETYIIVAGGEGKAVSDEYALNGKNLKPVGVTENSDDTLTLPDTADLDTYTWVAGGSNDGFSFKSVDNNNKYLGLTGFYIYYALALEDEARYWNYSGADLSTVKDSSDTEYLAYNTSRDYFVTKGDPGNNIKFYHLEAGAPPTSEPTSVPTAEPTPKPTPVPPPAPGNVILDDNPSGGYKGDYVIIYNGDASNANGVMDDTKITTGYSTGNMSGLIDTNISANTASGFIEDPDRPYIIDVDYMFEQAFRSMPHTQHPPEADKVKAGNKYAVGDTQNFMFTSMCPNGGNDSGGWTSLEFECLYVGQHCYIWTPKDKVQNYYALDTIDSSYAQRAANEFDKNFPTMQNYFGDFWDKYGDGRISLLYYNIDDKWELGKPYIGGYFNPLDYSNNSAAMIHIDTYPGVTYTKADGSVFKNLDITFHTVQHEFQHCINFGVVGGNSTDCGMMEVWLNEAFSAAAEEICYPGSLLPIRIQSWNGGTELNYLNPPQEFPGRDDIGLHKGESMYYWAQGNPPPDGMDNLLTRYGIVALFSQFLSNQKDNTIYKEIMLDVRDHLNTEVHACAKALGNITEEELLRRFTASLVIKSDMTIDGVRYGFKMQDGYDPANYPKYQGLENLYDLLGRVVFTGSEATINGGGFIIVKPKGGVYNPPPGASGNLKYLGVTLNLSSQAVKITFPHAEEAPIFDIGISDRIGYAILDYGEKNRFIEN